MVGCGGPCGGALRSLDVVFFGGNVPESEAGRRLGALFDRGEALLVVGSSLTVLSGFRFVRRARELGLPIAVINIGPTRADDLVQAKVAAAAAEVLPQLAAHLRRFSAQPA